jgi:hypothetical protein
LDHVKEEASIGLGGFVLCRMFTNSSGSYTRPKVIPGPSSEALKGLNWQVQVEPLSLSMTSLPPTPAALEAAGAEEVEPVDAVPDDPFDELPPQAVASIDAAASTPTHADPLNGSLFITHPLLNRGDQPAFDAAVPRPRCRRGRAPPAARSSDRRPQFGKPLNKSEYRCMFLPGQPGTGDGERCFQIAPGQP